jgi:hypothetical protein
MMVMIVMVIIMGKNVCGALLGDQHRGGGKAKDPEGEEDGGTLRIELWRQ